MSIDIWWQGIPDDPTTGVKVCVRASANGVIGLTVGNTRYTATADTGVNDGNVVLNATGLSPNKKFSFSLDFNGSTYFTSTDEKLRTFDISSSYKIGYGSCITTSEQMLYGFYAAEECDAFIFLGDTPYVDIGAGTHWGVLVNDVSTDQSLSNLYAFYRVFHSIPGIKYLGHRVPIMRMWDDHELAGDNWDHTTTQANAGGGGVSPALTLQSEVDSLFVTCQSAFEAYALCNPSNQDSPTNEAPFMADAAASNYHAKYFRTQLGNTEYFVPDCITHRGPIAAATRTANTLLDADARMLGDNQRGWLHTQLNASTAINKVITLTKKTYTNNLDNSDTFSAIGAGTTWPGFETERDLFLDYIHTNIVGCSTVSGDRHAFSLINQSSDRGEARDHVCVVACPLGTVQVNDQGIGFNDNVVMIAEESNYGVCHGKSDRMTHIVYKNNNRILWTGDVLATDNKLYYEPVIATI